MIKKLSALALVAVGLYLILKDQSPTRLLKPLLAPTSVEKDKTNSQDPSTAPQVPTSADSARGTSQTSPVQAAQTMMDAQQKPEFRLKAWENLHEDLPQSAPQLVAVALSPNPVKPEKDDHDHEEGGHGVTEYQFQREESLRIMAVQSLEQALLDKKITAEGLQNIAQNAASPSVRSIAKKVLEFAEKGMSYSKMTEAAISRLKVPGKTNQ